MKILNLVKIVEFHSSKSSVETSEGDHDSEGMGKKYSIFQNIKKLVGKHENQVILA